MLGMPAATCFQRHQRRVSVWPDPYSSACVWREHPATKLPNVLQVTPSLALTLLFGHLACQDKFPPVSDVPAYDITFRRHPDLTHLRLLAYRFFQRLEASAIRNEELEHLWRRPGVPKPIYEDAKYLVRNNYPCVTLLLARKLPAV